MFNSRFVDERQFHLASASIGGDAVGFEPTVCVYGLFGCAIGILKSLFARVRKPLIVGQTSALPFGYRPKRADLTGIEPVISHCV